MYWLFLASWEKIQDASDCGEVPGSRRLPHPPGFTTFWRRWDSVWSRYLRIRKSSQHAQCQTCFELNQTIQRSGGTWSEKMAAARALRKHHQNQYLDRCIYWSLRFASRNNAGVLVLIIDSPDKTSYAWPRWPFHRAPKELEGLIRPRVAITGVLAHGFFGSLLWAHEHQSHGASAFCEVLVRSLRRVQVQCQRSQMRFPEHLVIQSDNAVAQAKNSLVTVFLALLVSRGYFRSATLNFLIVGHTHEDIDQMFGLMIEVVSRKASWQTPDELMSFLGIEMAGHFRLKGEQFHVERVAGVRNFNLWLETLQLKVYNCFGNRDGVEAPHSFTFKLGQDLAASESSMCPHNPEALGTYCCVKTYMRDLRLQQAPELLLAELEVEQKVHQEQPQALVPLHALAPVAISGFLQLSRLCQDSYDMPLAAKALHHLAVDRTLSLPVDRWLDRAGHRVGPLMDTGNIYFPHLPETSWRLLVQRH